MSTTINFNASSLGFNASSSSSPQVQLKIEGPTTLNVAGSVSPNRVLVGNSVAFTIEITNTGAEVATDVVLNATIVDNVNFDLNNITVDGTIKAPEALSTPQNATVTIGDIPTGTTVVTVVIPGTAAHV